jgi:cation diffusion facilitator CzcD-associated flavoprotein CzcO
MNDVAKADTSEVTEVDAVVIGSGFAGLYSIHKLRNELGLNVQAFDNAGDVGGTWYWNQYPGARSDTEVNAYCYSFDKELFHEWKWTERYPRQQEIRSYLSHVADRHDLRRSIKFNTQVESVVWTRPAAGRSRRATRPTSRSSWSRPSGCSRPRRSRTSRARTSSAARSTTRPAGPRVTWT